MRKRMLIVLRRLVRKKSIGSGSIKKFDLARLLLKGFAGLIGVRQAWFAFLSGGGSTHHGRRWHVICVYIIVLFAKVSRCFNYLGSSSSWALWCAVFIFGRSSLFLKRVALGSQTPPDQWCDFVWWWGFYGWMKWIIIKLAMSLLSWELN